MLKLPLSLTYHLTPRQWHTGLVSWGRGCAAYPGVYSRISHEYDWIRKQVCWMSFDPPAYFHCTENERGPLSVSDSNASPIDYWSSKALTRAPSPAATLESFSIPVAEPTEQPVLEHPHPSEQPVAPSVSLPLSSHEATSLVGSKKTISTSLLAFLGVSWLFML